jgi:hypothetical protein
MYREASGESAPARAVARVFERLSRLRKRRIFHPYGVGFSARLTPIEGGETGAVALDTASEPIVRLSRSLGLPEPLPDPCGLAFRVPDAHGPGRHQDLLMVSSALVPVARHAILPARGFLDRPYSTLLPYRLRGRLVLLMARGLGDEGRGPLLADLRQRQRAGLEFELGVASLTGAWRPAARLSLRERLPVEETERLDLDPTNSGGGLELAGFLNRLRGPSYRASQAGRNAAY